MRYVRHALGLCLLSTVACRGGSGDANVGLAEWRVDASPSLVITDDSVPSEKRFDGISSAVRLRDGRVLVANTGAFTVMEFDPQGAFLRSHGRKGQGPAESSGPVSVYAGPGDSVAILDPGSRRWLMLDSTMRLVRMAPAPDSTLPQPSWMYRGAIVRDGLVRPVPAWVLAALDSARGADPAYTRLIVAHRDDLGALWIRDPADGRAWDVYTGSGAAAARVRLPEGLRVLQIGRDQVLGAADDADGAEVVQLHALERTGGAVADAPPAVLPRDSTLARALVKVLIAQETHYPSAGAYTVVADSLTFDDALPGKLLLAEADQRHWWGVLVNPATGATCGVAVGKPAPVGWLEGSAVCGR